MEVKLTKEQIDFIQYLCYTVYGDYEGYSTEEQKKRESLASEINGILSIAEEEIETDIDEKKLHELANEKANEYFFDECDKNNGLYDEFLDSRESGFYLGFKTGYRKAKEK